jgi:hypothetical protein
MMHVIYNAEYDAKEKHQIFGSVFDKTLETYYNRHGSPGMPFIVVINDNRFLNFGMKTNWLALNPNLTLHLKWKPEPNEEFGWKNDKGNLVARSVYWSSENFEMEPPKDSEAGNGWLSIVSEEGLKDLNAISNSFKIEKRVHRKYSKDEIKEVEQFDQTSDLTL